MLAATLLVGSYYLLPLAPVASGGGLLRLVIGVTLVAAVLAWQLRAVAAAQHPRLRAISAVAIGFPLLLVVFASVYLAQSQSDPAQFSEPLDHTDALYFAVTVFTTVGLGDITPVTAAARIATMLQMLLDLVVVGVVVRLLVGAVDSGLRRQHDPPDSRPD